MPNGKKHKRHKMSTHKRKKRLRRIVISISKTIRSNLLCGIRLIWAQMSCHKAFFIY